MRDLNLIYSGNGEGKTTIAAILRSLKNGDSNRILERKTIGSAGSPKVIIKINGDNYIFDGTGWDKAFSYLEIFDEAFINDNVYLGCIITHSHKEALCEFAIGPATGQLIKRIDVLDKDIRETNKGIREAAEAISIKLKGYKDVDTFVGLERLDDIDVQISEKKKELESTLKSSVLIQLASLNYLEWPALDYRKYEDHLKTGIDEVSEELHLKIKRHVDTDLGIGGESWLEQGIAFKKDKRCPFCGLDTSKSDLVKAYQSYFLDSYKRSKAKTAAFKEEVSSILSEVVLNSIANTVTNNETAASLWRDIISVKEVGRPAEDILTNARAVREALIGVLETKEKRPFEPVSFTSELIKTIEFYERGSEKVSEYNKHIKTTNEAIEEYKKRVSSIDTAGLEIEISKLEDRKSRFEPEVDNLCSLYKDLNNERNKKTAEKNTAKSKMQSIAEEVIGRYSEGINGILSDFAAGFRIGKLNSNFAGGTPNIDYNILINDIPVKIEPAKGNIGPTPSFKNTLSSGDKNALALAFFVARLQTDPSLVNKVIVFDDPVSSLDRFRRDSTGDVIRAFCESGAQVLVFSHDPWFLRLLWNNFEQSRTKTLYIERVSDKSFLREWDIERSTLGEYFENYFKLVEFVDTESAADLKAVGACIRLVLERVLKTHHPSSFVTGTKHWLGTMIEEISEKSGVPGSQFCCTPDTVRRLREINNYSKQFHHDTNDLFNSLEVDKSALKSWVTKTLDLIAKFPV